MASVDGLKHGRLRATFLVLDYTGLAEPLTIQKIKEDRDMAEGAACAIDCIEMWAHQHSWLIEQHKRDKVNQEFKDGKKYQGISLYIRHREAEPEIQGE